MPNQPEYPRAETLTANTYSIYDIPSGKEPSNLGKSVSQVQDRSPYAVTSFFCGLSQFILWGIGMPATSIVAIVFGHLALRDIKKTGKQGAGLATAGLVLGYLGAAFAVLAAFFMLLLFFSP